MNYMDVPWHTFAFSTFVRIILTLIPKILEVKNVDQLSTVVQMVKSGELGIYVRDRPNKCIINV